MMMMTRLLHLAPAAFLPLFLGSCKPQEEAPEARVEYHANWMTDWAAAKARAKEENKPILLTITGSDWCASCIQLDKAVFTDKPFKDFSDEKLVLMMADFPKKKELPVALKEQNEALKETYYNDGYPTVFLLDAEGNKLSEDLGDLEEGFGNDAERWMARLRELVAKQTDGTT